MTHTPRELAARSAQTGKGFPQQGQGTGIRSAAEACEERGIMFGNGLGNGGTPSQGGRQGKALFQVGVVLPHLSVVVVQIHGAPAHDLRHEGVLRQGGEQCPEAEPVHPLPGQVDAVGLLERCHDVGRVAPVVERGAFVRAAGGSVYCGFCGLFSGAVKLDEPAVFFLQVFGRKALSVKLPAQLQGKTYCWVSVKQFSKNDTATACQDWLRSTRLGRGSIKSHVRTVKVLGMGLFAFQERVHLWKGVTH